MAKRQFKKLYEFKREIEYLVSKIDNSGWRAAAREQLDQLYSVIASLQGEIDTLRHQKNAATPPAATDGFVMLPVEPTLDMLYIIAHDIFPDDWDVGKEAQRLGKKVPPRSEYESAYGQYKRLLAAAPTPSDSKPDTEQVNK